MRFFPEARVYFYLILSTYCVNLMIVLNNTQHETYSEQTVACVMPYWPLAAQCYAAEFWNFPSCLMKTPCLEKQNYNTLPKPSFCSHQPPFCLSLPLPSFILVDSRSVCLFEIGLCHSARVLSVFTQAVRRVRGFPFMAE